MQNETDANAPLTLREKMLGVLALILYVIVMLSVALCAGCSTAEAPTAAKAQNITAKDITVNVVFDGCTATNPPPVNVSVEIATAAQANETSGTDTLTATNTQTPTNDMKPTTTFTYGLTSNSASGTDWISQLTSASAKGLASWLKGGDASGDIILTKTDGTTATATACADCRSCTTDCGDCVTCGDCTIK